MQSWQILLLSEIGLHIMVESLAFSGILICFYKVLVYIAFVSMDPVITTLNYYNQHLLLPKK